MKDFISDEEFSKMSEAPDFIPDDHPILAKSENIPSYDKPSLAKRLYEQNVVIPVRAARHLAPFPETIQEQIIDPTIGYFTGETPEQRKAVREEYDRYLQAEYPRAREFYESRGAMIGGLAKGALAGINPVMAIQQATEPLVEQSITRPESLGFNTETALSTANLVIPAALSSPKYVAKGIAGIKGTPMSKQSLVEYQKDPFRFDAAEQKAGGQPIKSLEEEIKANIQEKEFARAAKTAELTGEVNYLKAEDARQVAEYKKQMAKDVQNVREQTALGTYEGDKIISAVKSLEEKYKETAEIRNKILDETKGEMPIAPLIKLVDLAEKRVILPEHKSAVRSVKDVIYEMSGDSGIISPRQLNELRANLQNSVTWSKHSQAWETQYKLLSKEFNQILDLSIPNNHPLRNQIREETIRYNLANDLFGGQYPIKNFESAIKDPMKRRAIENLDIPEINDIIKTIDYRTNFEKNLKFAETPKSDVIEEYLAKKKELELLKSSEKLPMTSGQAQGMLESSMMQTYRNPRINQTQAIQGYAEKVHPQGVEDFYRKWENAKVLRDISGIDTAQGSRMTNLGKGVGGAIGGALGMVTDNPSFFVPAMAGGGAVVGGALDYNASNVFRSAARGAKNMETVSKGYYPYAGMSRDQAIEHYLRSIKDPNYQNNEEQ